MREKKGTLSLTDCGAVSYKLLVGCQIASPEATERLFNQMEAVGRFELDADDVVNSVTDMVVHDIEVMKKNGEKLGSLGPLGPRSSGNARDAVQTSSTAAPRPRRAAAHPTRGSAISAANGSKPKGADSRSGRAWRERS